MIRIEVSNFQSIQHAVVAVDGYAAIQGRSDIGKSALVRAVQHALTGAVGTHFVRHGETCDRRVRGTKKCKCFSKVFIKNQKMEVTWEKGDAVNRYTVLREGDVTPEVYEGLDRGTPSFLIPDFQLVEVGDSKELVQIPSQFEPIFLLNKTGLVVADVLSDVAKLGDINKAMGMVTKDRKEAVSRRKLREEDVTNLQTAVAHFDGLDRIPTDSLKTVLSVLAEKQGLLKKVNGYIERLIGLKESLTGLDAALKPECPNYDSLEAPVSRLLQVDTFYEGLSEKLPVLKRLMDLDQVPLPGDESLLRGHLDLVKVDGFLKRLEALQASVEQGASVDKVELPDIEDLQDTCSNAVQVDGFLKKSDTLNTDLERFEALNDLPEVDPVPMDKMVVKIERVDGHFEAFKVLAQVVMDTQDDLKRALYEEGSVLEELKALGMCPTCETPLGEGAHLHLEAV